MELGAFSISLTVHDIQASQAFYKKLGFEVIGGDPEQNWLILKNGNSTIGLFQGMFDKNILTFNPGWDQNGKDTDSFSDVRELQKRLKKEGVPLLSETDETEVGPGSITLEDPDGNSILIDQHR
ncbi:VOC family protein [Salimicrobium sp. PL1-032A]|uniref:VOC family protein n=1 Tax=Salimicrobium sp. PL1-032A TaxID=3095364 RepID=UPI003260EC6E